MSDLSVASPAASLLSAAERNSSTPATSSPPASSNTSSGSGKAAAKAPANAGAAAASTPATGAAPTAANSGAVSESFILSLSEAALAFQQSSSTTLTANDGSADDFLEDGQKAIGSLSRVADQADDMADSIQGALDDLKESFEKLARLFGLSDEDAEAGGKAVRAAAADKAEDLEFGEISISRETTVVMKVEEVSVSYTREGPDGTTTVSASVRSVSMEVTDTITVGLSKGAAARQEDPLVLDMDGNGLDLTPAAEGESFDMDGDGTADQTAWVAGNDAFLAMDRDGDGAITSGKELFGDQNGAKDGFEELSKLDDNHDGKIDEKDTAWKALLLLHSDGTTSGLAESGITSLSLDAIVPMKGRIDDAGDLVAGSSFSRADGSTGMVGELYLDVMV